VTLTRWDKLKIYTRKDVAFIGRRDVQIRGAIKHRGIYYRADNLRVKDLLLMAGGTTPNAYTHEAKLLHQRPDGSFEYEFLDLDAAMKNDPANNVLLMDHDVLAIYTINEAHFVPKHTFSIVGEMVTPSNDYPRGDGMRLSDALRLAGGPTPKAGHLIQLAHARQEIGVPPVNIVYTPSTNSVESDPELQDGDVITVPGRGSFQEKPYVVMVNGHVNRPGPVILNGPQVHLSEVISAAGGLRPEAYPEGAQFTRAQTNLETTQQTRLAELITRVNTILSNSEYQRALAQSDLDKTKELGNALKGQSQIGIPGYTQPDTPGQLPPGSTNSLFSRDLVSPPRRLTMADLQSSGDIAVNLAVALRRPKSQDDILMKDGDTVTVPERSATIEIVGAVIHPQGVVYNSGMPLQYYIDRAGGYAPDAAQKRVLIIHVGGGLIPASKVSSLRPGDVILVPTEVLAAKIGDHSGEFDKIFKSLTTSVLTVLVAVKLFGL
jgi:protein involved in polysaccharide export with SLBB domain